MKIKRLYIEEEIISVIGKFVDWKRTDILEHTYDLLMGIVVDALNDDSSLSITDKVLDSFKEREEPETMKEIFGELVVTLARRIQYSIISEGLPPEVKYKFVKSQYASTVAVDEIVVDQDYTLACLKESKRTRRDVYMVNDESPDIETLDEYYNLETKRINNQVPRKF